MVDLWSGSYNLMVKHDHTLSVMAEDVVIPVSSVSSFTEFGVLPEGDTDDDNVVNFSDFFILRNSYNLSEGDPEFDARADFNEDDSVTSSDFFLLRNNYNQAGSSCSP